MSICLPNLRSTSVFKVYYGGTGQTSLTQGGVVIGNGTDAVQCITGSEGQVLTWDSILNTWVAKNPTGGSGGTGGSVPDIVIAPADNAPTTVIKKRFSNKDLSSSKIKLIDWDNSHSGSFRITPYDAKRKTVTIYNDSDFDLFISVANDNNPKLEINFEDKKDVKDIAIKYVYMSSSVERTLFDYNLSNIQNIHTYFTHSQNNTVKLGYNIDAVLNECSSSANLKIYLTKDYVSNELNKYLDFNDSLTGSFQIYLKSNPTIKTSFNLSSSLFESDYDNLSYSFYTNVSSSQFKDNAFITGSKIENINSFDFSTVGVLETDVPEEYSYIAYKNETVTITEAEACLPMFGYFLKSRNHNDTVVLRVTEIR